MMSCFATRTAHTPMCVCTKTAGGPDASLRSMLVQTKAWCTSREASDGGHERDDGNETSGGVFGRKRRAMCFATMALVRSRPTRVRDCT